MSLAIAIQTNKGIAIASDSRGTFGDPRGVTGANDTIQKVYGLTKYTAMADAFHHYKSIGFCSKPK